MNILIYQFSRDITVPCQHCIFEREISLALFYFDLQNIRVNVLCDHNIYIIVWIAIELSWRCSFVNLLWDFIYKRKPGFSASLWVQSAWKHWFGDLFKNWYLYLLKDSKILTKWNNLWVLGLVSASFERNNA